MCKFYVILIRYNLESQLPNVTKFADNANITGIKFALIKIVVLFIKLRRYLMLVYISQEWPDI